ncbi:hypothetical protein ABG067_005375 [Albugo candida]|uniref:Uncharacterized protein n=1 Tax=Albugo candida TaxID=65357 RepID=A0A024FTP7_9STRA|nr:unnamed protein product [Albugo candida]|eukprot:CCI10421.1 unnamed protein product [Albugo candida]
MELQAGPRTVILIRSIQIQLFHIPYLQQYPDKSYGNYTSGQGSHLHTCFLVKEPGTLMQFCNAISSHKICLCRRSQIPFNVVCMHRPHLKNTGSLEANGIMSA